MLTSLAFVFLGGLSAGALCQVLKLPCIVGMLFTGTVLGPYMLDCLDPSLLSISTDLRKLALIIILLKAGLSLDLNDLKKVGRPAVLLSFVPATFEVAGYMVFAPVILGITRLDAAVMGAVLAAVSPAVVVPKMVHFMESRRGTRKAIPQMIMAGASCDDIFVIVLFATFLDMTRGCGVSIRNFLDIPGSIVTGVMAGVLAGYVLYRFFEMRYERAHCIRNSMKVIIVLGVSFLLIALESGLKPRIPFSGLLAVVSMACLLKIKCNEVVSRRLSEKFGKLWLAAEVVLFVLVGAAVDVRYTLDAGPAAIGLVLVALVFRSVGVWLCTARTNLVWKERTFCVLAYLPKATVQAAIGAVPLAVGLPCGKIVLSVAVLGIVITAPLGAFAIERAGAKFLSDDR